MLSNLKVFACTPNFEAGTSKEIEQGKALADAETAALDAVLPQLGALVQAMGVEPWITSKIVSDARWDAFVAGCETFEGGASVPVFTGEGAALESQLARSHL